MSGLKSEAEYVAGNPRVNGSRQLVVISGCSGGGKSTLVSELGRRGYQTAPEPGRQIVKEQSLIGGTALPWKNWTAFLELCLSKSMYFYNSVSDTAQPAFFDRSIVDAVAGYERGGLPVPDYFYRALAEYRYGPVVFLAPPWPEIFTTDEERRHTFKDALPEFHNMEQRYAALGYEVVLLPKTGVSERADFVLDKVG